MELNNCFVKTAILYAFAPLLGNGEYTLGSIATVANVGTRNKGLSLTERGR